MVISLLIYALSWRSRDLSRNTLSLEDTIIHLENAYNDLKSESKINKKDIYKLKSINKDLQSIVDQIMQDKRLWASRIEKNIDDKDRHTVLRKAKKI